MVWIERPITLIDPWVHAGHLGIYGDLLRELECGCVYNAAQQPRA